MPYVGDWLQPGDVTRTSGNWASITSNLPTTQQSPTLTQPDAGALGDVIQRAWSAPPSGTETPADPNSIGPPAYCAVVGWATSTTQNGVPVDWTYVGGNRAGVNTALSWSGALNSPSITFSGGDFGPLPDGATAIELESASGTVLSSSLDYSLVETSRDGAADAHGSWDNRLSIPGASLVFPGPGTQNAVLATGSKDFAWDGSGTVPLSGDLQFYRFDVSDPVTPDIQIGHRWDTLALHFLIRPPRIRYTYTNPPTTEIPPLRQYPRGDGLATSSAPRLWPVPRSEQGGQRRGRAVYI